MTNPLHAPYYADRAVQARVRVLEHERLARDTYRVRFHAPDMARRALPGQFFMVRLAHWNDPLLGRALALYDTALDDAGQPVAIDVVFLAGGKFTRRLASAGVGVELDVWGPLGNGFAPEPAEHLVMVAGGIGQTPFPALARERLGLRRYGSPPRAAAPVRRVTLCYGARTADLLAGLDHFATLGVDVRVSTDDGSQGRAGLVTDLLRETLDESTEGTRVVCCGPEPMMEGVARLTQERGVPCAVSLETPMACGIGICFSCVARVRCGDGWDYKRTCVEGPVFDAAALAW